MAGVVVWGVSGYLVKLTNGVTDRGDPLLTAWILAWDQHQVVRKPLDLFQANIFQPYRDTLAFSENILGPALLAAPARLFTSNPIAVQNVSFVSAFVLLGLAIFFLLRWLTGDEIAAGVAAVAVAFSPERYAQLGHIQLLHTGGFAVLVYGLIASFGERRRAAAPLVAGALVFETLCSLYLGVMAWSSVAVGLAVLSVRAGRRPAAEALRRLLPWLALAAAVLLPIALPYQRLSEELDYGGSLEGQWANWASHKDYIRPLLGSLASKVIGPELSLPRGRSAYVGLLLSLLAAAAVFARGAEGDDRKQRERRAILLFVAFAVVFFSLSLGGWRTIRGHRLLLPWYVVGRLPGFSGMRAPVRFGILVDLAVVALAAIGLAKLRRRLGLRVGSAASGVLACAIGTFAFLERAPLLPIRPWESVETPAEAPHVYRWLARDGDANGVLELPMTVGAGEREPWDVVPYKQVYFSTIHWKRIVNGTSGYLPPGYWKLMERMWDFPRPDVVATLPLLPINRVVVHRTLYKVPIPSSTFAGRAFRVLHECPDDLVVAVKGETRTDPQPLRPVLRRIATASTGGALVLGVVWTGSLPAFLYPPTGFRIEARFEGADSRERSAGLRGWVLEPHGARAFRLSPGPPARRVMVEVTTDAGERVAESWNLQ